MAGDRAGLLARTWRVWRGPKEISRPVVAAICMGLLWGLTIGLYRFVLGERGWLAIIVISVLEGVLVYGPLWLWLRRREERNAREYFDDRPIPFSGGERT